MIIVQSAGMLTTAQDAGRPAAMALGMPRGGVMDALSARAANLLVGNSPDEAVLEITLKGPSLRFVDGAWIALGGAPVQARVGGKPLATATRCWVPPGGLLELGGMAWGCRSYLAVAGGLLLPEVLGSRAADLRNGLPGLAGRALQAGDCLPTGVATLPPPHHPGQPWQSRWRLRCATVTEEPDSPLRVIPANELPVATLDALWRSTFVVSPRSDRMGLRLSGQPLPVSEGAGRLSAGVAMGSLQLPPDGLPVVLGADAQTTGGYPLLGTVATADHGRLAQLRPGSKVTFCPVTVAEAHRALRRQQQALARAAIMLGPVNTIYKLALEPVFAQRKE